VVTILFVWIGWYVYQVERQRATVRWVEENGGSVLYDYAFDSRGDFLDNAQPAVPKWLLGMLDVNYFSSIVSVDFRKANKVSDLTPLTGLTRLEFLDLHDMPVSDLTPLVGLKNLEYLSIGNTQVSDLMPLAGLKNLEWLSLEDSKVSDLTPLAGLQNLKWLYLKGTQVSDEEIKKRQQALPHCWIHH